MESSTLGARLREARQKAGLTQKDAADALGVTYQAISNYERDKCRVLAGVLKQLCVLYHVSATELLQNISWTPEQEQVYRNAGTEAEKLSLFDLWGVPEDRQAEYAGLRRIMGLDNSPLTPEDGLARDELRLLALYRELPLDRQGMALAMLEAAVREVTGPKNKGE